MMMTNGFGAVLGSSISGYVIDKYFTVEGTKDWHSIWFWFAIYAAVIAVLFAVFFKHNHNSEEIAEVSH
jgi:NHS family xanthosine MFS transporter